MGMLIGNLRNLAPGRVVTRTAVLSVSAYQAPSVVDRGIDGLIGAGLLTDIGDGHICLTESSAGLAVDIHTGGGEVTTQLWSGQDERVGVLAALAARALRAAPADGGDAFALMAPLAEPVDATDSALLAERLTGLRFHRFDAHVAAWWSAGLTVDEIKNVPPGAARAAIELETNRRAATPYEALDPADRLHFLAGLAALRG